MSVTAIAPPQAVRFTVDDVFKMVEAGILRPDEKVELIHGEVLRVSPKHHRHEVIKRELVRTLARALPDDVALGVEQTLYLDETVFVEPDLLIHPRLAPTELVRGPDILLAVEVADTTLSYDLTVKAPLYAQHAIAELWVVDAQRLCIHVHRQPGPDTYAAITTHAAADALALPSFPSIVIRLSDIIAPDGLAE